MKPERQSPFALSLFEVKRVPQLANSIQLTLHLISLVAGLVFIYFNSRMLLYAAHEAILPGTVEAKPTAIAQYFWPGMLTITHLLFLAAVIIFTGSRLRALGNIVHECSHGIFLRNTRHNQFLGSILSLFLLQSFQKYQDDHRSHHKYLGLVGAQKLDLDLARYHRLFQEQGTENNLFKQLAVAIRPQNLKVAYLCTIWNPKDGMLTNCLRVAYGLCLLCLVVFLFVAAFMQESGLERFVSCASVLAALVPAVVVYPLLCVWSDIADHCIKFRTGPRLEAFAKSRNHIFKFNLLNLLFFPRNDAYHLVHHLFPSKPVSLYPKIHSKMLQLRPDYARLEHTLNITWRQT